MCMRFEREREKQKERERKRERERERGKLIYTYDLFDIQTYTPKYERKTRKKLLGRKMKEIHKTLCLLVCVCVREREREWDRVMSINERQM